MASTAVMTLRMKLRWLLAEHSLKDIHTDLLEIMEEEYSYLTSVLGPKKTRGSPAAAAPAPAPAAVPCPPEIPVPATLEELVTGLPKIRSDTKIRIVKKAQTQELVSEQVPVAPAPTTVQPSTDEAQAAPKEFYDPKDLKKWQKEKELEKNADLQKQGINPESLLTVESVKKWVEEDGRTYAYVAREFIGLPEAVVAAFAKKNGIKSSITKKRAILAAGIPRK